MKNSSRYFKIYTYETRRLLLNKVFISILVLFSMFSFYILNTDVIKGISYTAPFSEWSYSGYLCLINPVLLFITILCFLSFFSKKEEKAKEIIDTTPIHKDKLFLIRTMTVLTSYVILFVSAILISFLFYRYMFNYTTYLNFLTPILVVSLTSFIFMFGVVSFLSMKNITLSYVVTAVLIFLSLLNLKNLSLPVFLDPFAKHYIFQQPFHLPVDDTGDVAFTLTSQFIISRLTFILVGLILYMITLLSQSNKNKS